MAAANGRPRQPEGADPFSPIDGGSKSAGSSRTVSPGPGRGPVAADLPASSGASPATPSSSAREGFPGLSPPVASARQLNLRSWGPGKPERPPCKRHLSSIAALRFHCASGTWRFPEPSQWLPLLKGWLISRPSCTRKPGHCAGTIVSNARDTIPFCGGSVMC